MHPGMAKGHIQVVGWTSHPTERRSLGDAQLFTRPMNPTPSHAVKRYESYSEGMEEEPDGSYVNFDDYDQVRKQLKDSQELLRQIRDKEVNAQDEADKFLRDHVPSKLSEVRKQRDVFLEAVLTFWKENYELRGLSTQHAMAFVNLQSAIAAAEKEGEV